MPLTSDHNAYQRHYYRSLDKRTMQRTDSAYVRHKIDWMTEYAGLEPGHHILEIGSGLGKFSEPLLRSGHRLTCLDISEDMLADMKRELADLSFETLLCDVGDLPEHTDQRFDRVIGFFVLHHVPDLDAAFAAIAKVLEPGGVVAFCEPRAVNPLYHVQIALTPGMTWKAERGIRNMRPRLVEAAMRRNGLVSAHSLSCGLFPPFLTNTTVGGRVERAVERARLLHPLHAFSLFRAEKPA